MMGASSPNPTHENIHSSSRTDFSLLCRNRANVERIKKPLFIVQGKNDPRVPMAESEQMVKAIRDRSGIAWYLMAKDEGHGFAKKKNADFQFLGTILFLKQFLLN